MKGAGGTSGGILSFVLGAAMCVGGIWLLLDAVWIGSSFRGGVVGGMMGHGMGMGGSAAIVLIPLAIGVVLVFMDGKSKIAWGLIGLGLIAIAVEVASSLRFQFHMKMWHFLILLVCVFGGLGLMLRSLKASE